MFKLRFVPFVPLVTVLMLLMGESSQWLGKNIMNVTGNINFRKA